MKIIRVLAFGMIFFSSAWSQVWPHYEKKSWNSEFETQYSKWVEEKVGVDFFTRPGSVYKNMRVDCADLVYMLRMIFSMEHGLEFAIHDPIRPGRIISSRSLAWNRHTEKVKSFFQYILDITSTQTLPNDTVLVPMTKQDLRPGVILLGDKQRGHSMILKKISSSGIPTLVYGTLPAREFLYLAYHFPDPLSYFPMGPISQARGRGFRRFRWPEDLKKAPAQISYSNEDQIRAGKMLPDFFNLFQSIVRTQPTTRDEVVNYLIDDLCSQMRVRTNTTTDAHQFLNLVGGRPLSNAEEERFSTNKRDQNILTLIAKLRSENRVNFQSLKAETRSRLERVFNPEGTNKDECLVDWAENRIEPLGWIIERFEAGLVSSRSTDSLGARWGLP